MKKTSIVLGLFAVMFVGLITPALAESDNWNDSYFELEKQYDEQRWNIEKEFDNKYEELSKYYEEQKNAIYEKIELDSTLSDDQIDKMFVELFDEFEEKQEDLDMEFTSQLEELDMMFGEKFEQFDNEFGDYSYEEYDERYDDYDAAGNYIGDKYDDDNYEYDERYESDYHDEEPYMDDPEWKSIEPLVQKIQDSIPMEKIQHLWESDQIDELVKLVISETDLSTEDAKRVIIFFEKYEHDDSDYYDNHSDDSDFLEQRIIELEEENKMLRETISELEEKISQLNVMLMEQVKIIYEWVLSQ